MSWLCVCYASYQEPYRILLWAPDRIVCCKAEWTCFRDLAVFSFKTGLAHICYSALPSFLVSFAALCFVFCTFDAFPSSFCINPFLLPSSTRVLSHSTNVLCAQIPRRLALLLLDWLPGSWHLEVWYIFRTLYVCQVYHMGRQIDTTQLRLEWVRTHTHPMTIYRLQLIIYLLALWLWWSISLISR